MQAAIQKQSTVPWQDVVVEMSFVRRCTSSTAQGGGGSFKNRKPVGEIGCCESGMAEQKH